MITVLIPTAHLLLMVLEIIYRFSSVCLLTFDEKQVMLQAIDVNNSVKVQVIMSDGFIRHYSVSGDVKLPFRGELRRNVLFRKLKETCKPGDILQMQARAATMEVACSLLKKNPLKIRSMAPAKTSTVIAAAARKKKAAAAAAALKRKSSSAAVSSARKRMWSAGGTSSTTASSHDSESSSSLTTGESRQNPDFDAFYRQVEDLQASEPTVVYADGAEMLEDEDEDSRIIVLPRVTTLPRAAPAVVVPVPAISQAMVTEAATSGPLAIKQGEPPTAAKAIVPAVPKSVTETQTQVDWILLLADDYQHSFAQVDLVSARRTAPLIFTIITSELAAMCKDLCVVGERVQVTNLGNTVTLHSMGEVGPGGFTCIDPTVRKGTIVGSGPLGALDRTLDRVHVTASTTKKSRSRRRPGFALQRATEVVNETFSLRSLSLATEGFGLSPEVQILVQKGEMVLYLRSASNPHLEVYMSMVGTEPLP